MSVRRVFGLFLIGKSIIAYRFFFSKKQQREIFNKIGNEVIGFYYSNSILLNEIQGECHMK